MLEYYGASSGAGTLFSLLMIAWVVSMILLAVGIILQLASGKRSLLMTGFVAMTLTGVASGYIVTATDFSSEVTNILLTVLMCLVGFVVASIVRTQARVAHDTLGERSSLREEGAHRAQSASNNRSAPARALRTAPSSATVVAAAEASVWPTAPAPTGALAAAKAPLFTPTHRCRAHRAFHGGLCYRMGNGRLPLRR